jgi:hypothetical protein
MNNRRQPQRVQPRAQTLPTRESLRRAARTFLTGENYLRDADIDDETLEIASPWDDD